MAFIKSPMKTPKSAGRTSRRAGPRGAVRTTSSASQTSTISLGQQRIVVVSPFEAISTAENSADVTGRGIRCLFSFIGKGKLEAPAFSPK